MIEDTEEIANPTPKAPLGPSMDVDNLGQRKPRNNSSAKYYSQGKPDSGKETRTCYNSLVNQIIQAHLLQAAAPYPYALVLY
jgi:hypothetical protein